MSTTALHDVRFAYRSLRRTPAASLLAVLTLALGIAASVTTFSILNTVLLKPLPFARSQSLVWITATDPDGGLSSAPVNWHVYQEWRERTKSLESLAAFQDRMYYLTRTALATKASGADVTPSLFAVLGVDAHLGRTFLAAEADEAAVILGHDLWRRSFEGDEEVLGQTVRVAGRERVVVGVMPPAFRFPEYAELWLPLSEDRARAAGGASRMSVVGRLADGAVPTAVQRELARIAEQVAAERPELDRGTGVSLVGLRDHYIGPTGVASLVFVAVAAGLLLVICVNLASFLLARAVDRRQEMALRSSLGADRRQILRQLLTESLVLAVVGGALGLLLGAWGLRLLVRSIPIDLPFWAVFGIDWRVVAFTVAAVGAAGLLFGVAPATYAFRFDLSGLLKTGRHQGGRTRRRVLRLLVAGQLALAFAFLLGAAAMSRSFLALQSKERGFEAPPALAVKVDLQPLSEDPTRHLGVQRRLIEDLESLPGVAEVALASAPPLSPLPTWTIAAAGRESPDEEQAARVRVVSHGYTELLGIPLLAGRRLEADDEGVALVNRELVRRLWGKRSAIGRTMKVGDGHWVHVVGTVGSAVQDPLDDRVLPEVYLSTADRPLQAAWVLVAATGDPASLAAPVRRRLAEVSPDLVIERVAPLEELLDQALWQPKLYSWLLGVLAVAAVCVAALGLYGMVAYGVGRRLHEFSIRMAVGAERRDIRRLVLANVLLLMLVGLGGGFVLSLGLGRVLNGALNWYRPSGPVLAVCIAFLFAAVALTATWAPCVRAARSPLSSMLRRE